MSLVGKIYGFTFNLSKPEQDVYSRLRVKITQHPYESMVEVNVKALAYINSYREGLQIGPGLYKPDEPALLSKDSVGNVELAIYLGSPDRKIVERSLRRHPVGDTELYVWQDEHLESLWRELRGTLLKNRAPLRIFKLDADVLDTLSEIEVSSPTWAVNQSDGTIYLDADGRSFELTITELDLRSLLHQPEAPPIRQV